MMLEDAFHMDFVPETNNKRVRTVESEDFPSLHSLKVKYQQPTKQSNFATSLRNDYSTPQVLEDILENLAPTDDKFLIEEEEIYLSICTSWKETLVIELMGRNHSNGYLCTRLQ